MNYKSRKKCIFFVIFFIFSLPFTVFPQTRGKVVGSVVDAKTGKSLIGAQIMITAKWIDNKEVELDEIIGAVADENGDFFIINIPPDYYTIVVQMMGYETKKFEKVRVSVNRTLEIVAELNPTVVKGKEVIVTATPIEMKKDQTSSIRNVTSDEIEKLPVESIDQVVSMQPGIVVGHFRGGRWDEVSYLIDGIQVDESFGGGRTVSINPEVIEEVEVITGTFNAEYGRAMSGIVNVVTKEGGNIFNGSCSINPSNYFTTHNDIFIGLNKLDINEKLSKDFKFSLAGPLLKNRLTFIVNGRYQDNKGHLCGIHRFNVDDYSDFISGDSAEWYSEHNGTDEYVIMDWGKNTSFFSKFTFNLSRPLTLSLMLTYNDGEGQGYDHFYKYNPYGRATGYGTAKMIALQANHMLTKKAFYELKASYVDNYNGNYVFKNLYNTSYIHDAYARSQGPGFITGGQQKHHNERWMKDYNIKWDLNWQLNKNNSIKAGILYTYHYIDNRSVSIRNKYQGTEYETYSYYDSTKNKMTFPYYEPIIYPDSSVYSDIYKQEPKEFSCYIQDKMEFDEMVINLGVRLDYFDPNTYYPSQWRNPANQLLFEDSTMMSFPINADPKYQISPRFGISYKLGEEALLRFSYGHFFQIPPLYSVYQNHSFLVSPSDFSTVMGNPQINAQKTIQYEVGLWQELMPGMDIEVAVFYKDIYDLLSTKIVTTFNQIRYGLYSNKDYGNVRGLEIKYNLRYGFFIATLNYTFQYTHGNADTPTFTFDRAGQEMDPVNRMIPMSWDQRHTLNVSAGYHKSNYGGTITFFYNSGTPYTWTPIPESPLSRVNLFPNNDYQPSEVSVDLSAYYNLFSIKGINGKVTILVYNLFDKLNDAWVYGTTGRAYTTIVRENEIMSHHSDFNDYWDRVKNPAMYSSPRLVKVGFELSF
jgi:outer membrane receptor protein involved in Fe transport